MILGLGHGPRSRETGGLCSENVDLDAGIVRVRNGIDTIDRNVVFTPLKT